MSIGCRSVCLPYRKRGLFLERCSGWDGVEGEDRRGVELHVGEWDKELGRSLVALIRFPGPSNLRADSTGRTEESKASSLAEPICCFHPMVGMASRLGSIERPKS